MWSARTSAVAQLTRGVRCITRRALKSWSWSSLYRFKGLDGLMVFFLSSRSAHGGDLRSPPRGPAVDVRAAALGREGYK